MQKKNFILWFTGMSGAGKTTLAKEVKAYLETNGFSTKLLDGDEIRKNLSKTLGFSEKDRKAHMIAVGHMAKVFFINGDVVIVALISPFREVRGEIRALFPSDSFFEIYCNCPFDILAKRDPKGLYKRALAGEIKDFTGLDSPYEPPESPEISVHTDRQTVEESLSFIFSSLKKFQLLDEEGE